MLLNYFKSNRTSIIFLLPLIALLLWSNIFWEQKSSFIPLEPQMPAYALLMSWIPNGIISDLIALVLIVAQGFYLIYINQVYNFISNKTYLTGILFVLISGAYINLHYLHPAIIANAFILQTIVELFSSYRKQRAYKVSFNSGFYIALASLFYINAGVLILFVFIGLSVLHTFNWREWFIVLIGFITPYIITSGILVGLDLWMPFTETLSAIFYTSSPKFSWSLSYHIFVMVLSIIGFISVFKLSSTYTNNKVSTRSYFYLLIVLLLMLIAVFLIVPFASIELIIPVAIPLSYLLTNYYLSDGNKWVQNISYTVLLLSLSYFYIEKLFLSNVSPLF